MKPCKCGADDPLWSNRSSFWKGDLELGSQDTRQRQKCAIQGGEWEKKNISKSGIFIWRGRPTVHVLIGIHQPNLWKQAAGRNVFLSFLKSVCTSAFEEQTYFRSESQKTRGLCSFAWDWQKNSHWNFSLDRTKFSSLPRAKPSKTRQEGEEPVAFQINSPRPYQ